MSDSTVEGWLVIRGPDFDDLYRHSFDAVVRAVAGISMDLEVATEIAQDSFAAAHRHWRKVSAYDRPDLWVRRVAINKALSFRRRARNETRALAALVRRQAVSETAWSGDPELWRQVRRLPKRQAAMIVLVYVDDLSIQDAAAVLRISVSTAKTHLQRARRSLATRLKEDLE